METIKQARDYFYHLHDIECNQKYNKTLPYSFHLDMVEKQFDKFKHLIIGEITNMNICLVSCFGHDSIEDARITYNDLKDMFGIEVAETIYLCTENKGRNRLSRKSNDFYDDLMTNKLAVFVKLCDLIANVKFSLLSNSSMFNKYKREFDDKRHYFSDYPQMVNYLDSIFRINQ